MIKPTLTIPLAFDLANKLSYEDLIHSLHFRRWQDEESFDVNDTARKVFFGTLGQLLADYDFPESCNRARNVLAAMRFAGWQINMAAIARLTIYIRQCKKANKGLDCATIEQMTDECWNANAVDAFL